jgi:hypothetical protein
MTLIHWGEVVGLAVLIFGASLVWHFGKPSALYRTGGIWLNGKDAIDPSEAWGYRRKVKQGIRLTVLSFIFFVFNRYL